jgi:hypothetical protein
MQSTRTVVTRKQVCGGPAQGIQRPHHRLRDVRRRPCRGAAGANRRTMALGACRVAVVSLQQRNLPATCSVRHADATCDVRDADATHDMQYATYDMQHTTCSMQHAAYNMIALCPAAGADSLRTTPRRCTPPGRATRGPLEPHHTYSRCGCMRHASPPPISGLCTCAGGSVSQRHPSQVQPRPRGIPGKALWPPPVDVSNERSRLRVPRRFMAEAISTRPLGRIRPRF